MSTQYIRSIYRRLWRASTLAVKDDPEGLRVIRNKLRTSFRTETVPPTPIEVHNTERFLRVAGKRRGVEIHVVRNLLLVEWDRLDRKRYERLEWN